MSGENLKVIDKVVCSECGCEYKKVGDFYYNGCSVNCPCRFNTVPISIDSISRNSDSAFTKTIKCTECGHAQNVSRLLVKNGYRMVCPGKCANKGKGKS
jgi:hypothetical protein